MRNVLSIPFQGTDTLIIATDNSGAVGMKEDDTVFVPYDTTAYFSFRVAVMECMAAGAEPFSVILNNFCGDEAWEQLAKGIQKGIDELHLNNLVITGSTESNFSMLQSAIGITVLGKRYAEKKDGILFNKRSRIAIIGKPLMGSEVVEQADQIVPLPIFQRISRHEDMRIWPVGSKGILFELNQMIQNETFFKEQLITDVDVSKSSGPATCFIALFEKNQEPVIKKLTGSYFHSLKVVNLDEKRWK